MTYSEKLKDPRWQAKRIEILNRDKRTCRNCGAKETILDIHHLFYYPSKEPWEYDNKALITLCRDCHDREEQAKDLFMGSIQRLLQSGFTYQQLAGFITNIVLSGKQDQKIKLSLIDKIAACDNIYEKGLSGAIRNL